MFQLLIGHGYGRMTSGIIIMTILDFDQPGW